MCQQSDYTNLSLDPEHAEYLRLELKSWHKWYLPTMDPECQWDIGAGCGETAQFYLLHGCKHVVCVESDKTALEHLYRNFGSNPRVTIIPLRIGAMKMDIDGAEKGLVVETHFPVNIRQIMRTGVIRMFRIEESFARDWPDLRYKLHLARITIAHEIRYILDRIDEILGDNLSLSDGRT